MIAHKACEQLLNILSRSGRQTARPYGWLGHGLHPFNGSGQDSHIRSHDSQQVIPGGRGRDGCENSLHQTGIPSLPPGNPQNPRDLSLYYD